MHAADGAEKKITPKTCVLSRCVSDSNLKRKF